MVIISTSAVEVSIQAVSPVSIFGPSSCARAGAAASSATAAPASTRAGILIVLSPIESGSPASERRHVGLAGADAERPLHVQHEDLAVADLVGAGGLRHRLE